MNPKDFAIVVEIYGPTDHPGIEDPHVSDRDATTLTVEPREDTPPDYQESDEFQDEVFRLVIDEEQDILRELLDECNQWLQSSAEQTTIEIGIGLSADMWEFDGVSVERVRTEIAPIVSEWLNGRSDEESIETRIVPLIAIPNDVPGTEDSYNLVQKGDEGNEL